MLLTRSVGGFGGLGALPPMQVSQHAIDNAIRIPGARETRLGLYTTEQLYNHDLALKAWQTRQMIQPVQCIGNTSTLDPSISKSCDKDVSPERILMPLGVLNVLDVPFAANELIATGEDGVLERTYSPDWYQAVHASYYAYVTSQSLLLDIVNTRLKMFGGVTAPQVKAPSGPFELWCAGLDSAGKPLDPTKSILSLAGYITVLDKLEHKSDPGALKHLFDRGFVTAVGGFYNNPIEPTADEMNKEGGTLAYYQRGGFVLAVPVVTGQVPVQQTELRVNLGYFMCADGKLSVATEKIPDEGHGWLAYVTFGPTGTASWIDRPLFSEMWGSYKIRVQMKDRSTWESIKKGVTDFVKKAAEIVCAAAPIASSVANQMAAAKTCKRVAPAMATQAQKTAAGCTPIEIAASSGTTPWQACQVKLTACKEGEPGCVCTAPATGTPQQMAIAAGGAFLQAACRPGAADAPMSCNQYAAPAGFPTWAKWLLAGVAALGGAAYAAKRM